MWPIIAHRIVTGAGVRPGELIQIRDDTGRFPLITELSLAIEKAGATPLLHLAPLTYMERLWRTAPQSYLEQWDHHRSKWLHEVDRIIVLASTQPDLSDVPQDKFTAWATAEQRLSEIEESRKLPYLMVGIPTQRHAKQLGLTLAQLEKIVFAGINASVDQLRDNIDRVNFGAFRGKEMVIQSGENCELQLGLGERPWLTDDGYIDDEDIAKGAIVSNLPAGSAYTTVVEEQTTGTLHLPQAAGATNAILTFTNGRVTHITAESGTGQLEALFDRHQGEPRRIGHIGIGLNPALKTPIGWTVVDEHVLGHLFVSFGENRYMGGQNASTLNVDFTLPSATLTINGRMLVKNGKLRPWAMIK